MTTAASIVLFLFLQLFGRPHHFAYAAAASEEGTITYQYNVSGWDAISLHCDGAKSNPTTANSTIGPICKVDTPIVGNCLTSFSNGVFDANGGTPYFLPTNKDDYLEITNCVLDADIIGDDDDDDGDIVSTNRSSTRPSRLGLVTVTCDAACTCDTGSYPTVTDKDGTVGATLTFEPDGGKCPIVSTQPNEQLGPSTPLGPSKYFSDSSLEEGEILYVVCEGREEDEPVFGVCTADLGTFSSYTSGSDGGHRLEYQYFDCLEDSCSVKCPSVCNCTVETSSNMTGGRNCAESNSSLLLESSSSTSRNPMYQLFRAMGLIAVATSILEAL